MTAKQSSVRVSVLSRPYNTTCVWIILKCIEKNSDERILKWLQIETSDGFCEHGDELQVFMKCGDLLTS